jgi:hypothetical protein
MQKEMKDALVEAREHLWAAVDALDGATWALGTVDGELADDAEIVRAKVSDLLDVVSGMVAGAAR